MSRLDSVISRLTASSEGLNSSLTQSDGELWCRKVQKGKWRTPDLEVELPSAVGFAKSLAKNSKSFSVDMW